MHFWSTLSGAHRLRKLLHDVARHLQSVMQANGTLRGFSSLRTSGVPSRFCVWGLAIISCPEEWALYLMWSAVIQHASGHIERTHL